MTTTLFDLAEKQAALCRVFSNSRRLLILWLLSKDELSVNEITARAGTTLQNVSQHLSLLRKAGIVTTRREGQTIYYQIADLEYLRQCPALLRAPNTLEQSISTHTNVIRRITMTVDLNTLQATKVVDARAMSCPGPLLEAKKAIGTVKVNEVLEIWSGDANTKNDMPRWCEKVGHEFLGFLAGEGYERLFIRRKK